MQQLGAGTRIHERYRIVHQIGQGGMGAVYEAVDERLEITVALKRTLLTGDDLDRQFEREARLLAGLRHPALPRVTDHFSDQQGQFLVMEYIAGSDLADLLAQRREPFPVATVLQWADQLLAVLVYLHGHQPPIIHRDIKPQNLKLTPTNQIVLLDFGLAKQHLSTQGSTTSGLSVAGFTPQYAPPEQIERSGTDARSDLYSLAATLYRLLSATHPESAITRATASVSGRPDPLRSLLALNPAVPAELSVLLHQALALDPARRPASAAEVRARLRAIAPQLGQPSVAVDLRPVPPTPQPGLTAEISGSATTIDARKPARPRGPATTAQLAEPRRWMPAALAVLLLITLSVGALGLWGIADADRAAQTQPTQAPEPTEDASIASAPTATPTQRPATPTAPPPTATAPPATLAPPLTSTTSWSEFCFFGPRVLPSALDPAADFATANAEIIRVWQQGEIESWPIIATRIDPARTVSLFIHLTRPLDAEQEPLRVSNMMEAEIEQQAGTAEHVHLVFATDGVCGGAGTYRIFPALSLDGPAQHQLVTQDAEFFRFQPGEQESFIVPVQCAKPGSYELELQLIYGQQEQSGSMSVPAHTQILCPESFTLWMFSMAPGQVQLLPSSTRYIWDGSAYVEQLES